MQRFQEIFMFPTPQFLNLYVDPMALLMKKSSMGKKIISRRYHGRIRDGSSVKVFKDPWIPKPLNFKVFDEPHISIDMFVIDLKFGTDNAMKILLIENLMRIMLFLFL